MRKKAVRLSSYEALESAGLVDGKSSNLKAVAERYAIGITPQILGTIGTVHGNDPVSVQFIPDARELQTRQQEDSDPIGDETYSPVKGIVHRYPDRVLLKITSICAVYCRYCFRREMVGKGEKPITPDEIAKAIDYIAATPQIREVILTGGDPFILSVRKLKNLFSKLNQIDHLDIIRIHTRIPVSDPVRITDDLTSALKKIKNKAVYIAIHVNHAQEINAAARNAILKLHQSGCSLLSQSVLLKSVNDSAATLEDLFRALLKCHVKPYYLHHPDLAPGTAHFRLSLKEGQAIVEELLGRVSGLCRPHYMLDIPGGHGKIPVTSDYVEDLGAGRYSLKDYQGNTHIYEDDIS